MKQPVKRVLSAVLVVLMCISLLSGLSFAATVNYQTGNPSGFQDVILNWGTRGTDATFLSPNAEAFYQKNNIDYEELAELSGNSNTGSTPNSPLYKALQQLMRDNHDVITSYNDTRPLYSYTDCQESSRSKLTCFYSGNKIGPDWDSGNTWNREHTWPNSKGLGGSDENDIMMLRPTSTKVNSSRGNDAYGEGSGYYDPNKESNGKYNLHGDVARIFLYVYVRWGNTSNAWGTNGVMENKDVLLKWMKEDPVDTWEMGRNDSVESITGTRNVFVDYPELAFELFDAAVPSDMVTPSGENKTGNSHKITVLSNNGSWGTSSLSGNTITAAPKAGYGVAGYVLISGTATVTRNGNVFTLNPSSDCIIQITFAPRTLDTVRFMENGVVADSRSIYTGDSYTLPQHSTDIPTGYTFQGWVTNEQTETSNKPTNIYQPATSHTADGDLTYYALYSRLDASGSGSSSSFDLFSGQLVDGNYLITYNNGAMAASVTKNRMDIAAITPNGNTVDDPADSIIWKVAFTSDGYVTVYNEATGSYVGGTGAKSQAGLLTSVTDYAKWTVTGDSTYDFVNLGNEINGVNKTLRRNLDYGFACYATATGGALTLYKQGSGAVYYCTNVASCEHINIKNEAATAPSCTENGYTAGVYCNDCTRYISGHEVLPAPGHSYRTVVTPPTDTEQGFTTYTCTVCGDCYVGDYVDALGEQFTVTFVVPAGVDSIASQTCGKSGITLPTAGIPQNDKDYAFIGWTTVKVEDTDTAPAVLTGAYTATKNITLYALYSYVVGGGNGTEWKLVTNAASLRTGDQIVLASNQKGKVAGNMNGAYLTDPDAQFSQDLTAITTLPDTAMVFTLGQSDDFWTLNSQNGQQLGCTAVKKLAWNSGTWTIDIDDAGLATVSNSNASYGRFLYNANNGSQRFTTYTSGTSSSMLMPQLYKLEGDLGTTYYTTAGSVEPVGVTLSGTVSTGIEGVTTLQLVKDGNVIATVTATGKEATYTVDNVVAGTYTLKVSKQNHATREYTVTVNAAAQTLDVKIHLIGDLDGNGKVNIGDVCRLYAHIKGTSLITDAYQLLCANVTDGDLNLGDVSCIYAHITGTSKLY